MKIELSIETENKIVVGHLREAISFLRGLPERERDPEDGLLIEAIKRVLAFYGERG